MTTESVAVRPEVAVKRYKNLTHLETQSCRRRRSVGRSAADRRTTTTV